MPATSCAARTYDRLTTLLRREFRDELRQHLWPADVFVAFDQSLNNVIKKLRAALRDPGENPPSIETVARQGYRFIAPVALPAAVAAAVPPRRMATAGLVAAVALCAISSHPSAAQRPSRWRRAADC
jgi:hypothetical protein